MRAKAAPVHSIEPQIYAAAMQAKADGIERMIIGESSDLIFGGMDQFLSSEWSYDDFKNRYIFIPPKIFLQTQWIWTTFLQDIVKRETRLTI